MPWFIWYLYCCTLHALGSFRYHCTERSGIGWAAVALIIEKRRLHFLSTYEGAFEMRRPYCNTVTQLDFKCSLWKMWLLSWDTASGNIIIFCSLVLFHRVLPTEQHVKHYCSIVKTHLVVCNGSLDSSHLRDCDRLNIWKQLRGQHKTNTRSTQTI